MYAKYTIYRVYTQHTNAVRRIYSEEKINVRSALSEYVKVSVGTKVAAAQRDSRPYRRANDCASDATERGPQPGPQRAAVAR